MIIPPQFIALSKRIGLPATRYFESINSTNLEGIDWLNHDAPDGAVVFADHQSAGRGRFDRLWVTNPGCAIAVSILIHPHETEMRYPMLFSPLAGLALASVLRDEYQLPAMIKWPNDVLIEGRKTAGILSEAVWLGESLAGIVVGTGINILPQSVPPADQLQFPATCVQQHVDRPVNRFDFLEAYLKSFFALRKQLTSPQFINQWEKMLAFRGEKVYIKGNDNVIQNSGTIMGIEPNGDLRLLTADNQIETITAGDVHLRPAINRDFGRP